MDKEQQKKEAWKVYQAKIDPAYKAYRAIVDSAIKVYFKTADPALKACEAKCKEIDEQEDVIKIIDGKRYKLIEE